MSTAIIRYKDIKGEEDKKKKKVNNILRVIVPDELPKQAPINTRRTCFDPDRNSIKRVVVNPRKDTRALNQSFLNENYDYGYKVKAKIKRVD